jgi:isopentenyl-diphosphate delta-isomerase
MLKTKLSQVLKTSYLSLSNPKSSFSLILEPNLAKYDTSQTKFMDEALILVDEKDQVIRKISKVEAHLNSFNTSGLAHRAFSCFLFNKENKLLIHQRSHKKITFPLLWTNSCCSHPLYNKEEMEETDFLGIKKYFVK